MRCINCIHLNDSGTEWYCLDWWGNRVQIHDPYIEFHCDDFEEEEEWKK